MLSIKYLNCNNLSTMLQNNNDNTALLELCGGLCTQEKIARWLGAHTAVMDQDILLSQLNYNMQHSFTIVINDNISMQAKLLSWSKDNIHSLMRDLDCDKTGVKAVANCDYFYEPLCVKINELLVDVMINY